MGVTKEELEKLKEPMDYKFRVQSTKYGKSTIVNYIDSRALQDRFDDVCGAGNWANDFKVIDGNLYAGIGVNVDDGYGKTEWVWKYDVGVESNVDKEKGEASDAMKRAGVLWGCGRFLYSLGIITLKAVEHQSANGNKKEYPATRDGKILWNVDELTEYCKKLKEQGITDDTKAAHKKPDDSKPPQKKTSTAKSKEESTSVDADKGKALVAIKEVFNKAGFSNEEVSAYFKSKYDKESLEDYVKNTELSTLRAQYTLLDTLNKSGKLVKA